MANYRVGMEIGANRASMCMVDEQGAILCRRVFGAVSTGSPERFVDTLCDHLEDMLLKRGMTPMDVRHIGVGIAGCVDRALAVVTQAPVVFGASPVPLARLMEERVGVVPLVMCDVWAAANAELHFGIGAKKDFLCVTLGKQNGVTLVRGGEILTATADDALSIALAALRENSEKSVSSGALVSRAKERCVEAFAGEKASVRDVFMHADAGEEAWLALLNEAADSFANALISAMVACGLQAAVLGGMLSAYKTLLIDPIREAALQRAQDMLATEPPPEIRQAVFGGDCVMVGAAFFGKQVLR